MSSSLPNPDKQTYSIALPKTDASFVDLGENIIYNDTLVNKLNQCLMDTSAKGQINCSSKIIVHFVKQNETIESIAEKYSVTPEQIRSWNSLSDSTSIKVNDELILFKDNK
jgi:LysM repeat protein